MTKIVNEDKFPKIYMKITKIIVKIHKLIKNQNRVKFFKIKNI